MADKVGSALRMFINRLVPTNTVVGTVIFVNEKEHTCDVKIDDGLILYDVRLSAAAGGADTAVIIIPEMGSDVLVSMIQNDATMNYVSAVGKAAKIILRDGSLGGMVKVEKLTDRLNTIEKAYNDLLNEYKIHTHTGVQTGGGTSGATVSTRQKIETTKRSDIENEKVKHG